MDQKKEFVREYRRGLYTMTELAERYAISRKAGYALVRRVEELGVAGLQPQSRRPHTSPNRTPVPPRRKGANSKYGTIADTSDSAYLRAIRSAKIAKRG